MPRGRAEIVNDAVGNVLLNSQRSAENMRIIVFKFLFAYFGFQAARYLGDSQLLGMLVGLLFGHTLDIIATHKFMVWRYSRIHKKQAEAAFNKEFTHSLFFMFGKICGCDGAVVKDEINAVQKIMAEVLKLSKSDQREAVKAFKSARTSTESFQSNAVCFYELYRQHTEVLEGTIQMFMRVAASDGVLKSEEDQLIQTAASVFGIDNNRYKQMRKAYMSVSDEVGDLDKCYALLGCEKTDSDSQIKSCYRKLVTRYHPDTIHAKDLPEEFIQFANRKMQDIQKRL